MCDNFANTVRKADPHDQLAELTSLQPPETRKNNLSIKEFVAQKCYLFGLYNVSLVVDIGSIFFTKSTLQGISLVMININLLCISISFFLI